MAKKSMKKSKSVSSVKKVLNTGFLLSVGIASIAKENAEKITAELVKRGRLNECQGRKLVNNLIKRSRK